MGTPDSKVSVRKKGDWGTINGIKMQTTTGTNRHSEMPKEMEKMNSKENMVNKEIH